MKALIFDTETTGIKEPEIIEAAWLEIRSPRNLAVLDTFEARFKPSKAIELGAMATHNIMDEDLVECVSSASFYLPQCDFIVGHNVDYDWRVADEPDVKIICTLALSRYIFPNLDSHKQSAMLYHLRRESARHNLQEAHSALADVWNCLRVLEKLMEYLPDSVETWDDLWAVSEIARVPTVMPFGKHKGELIANIPVDYKVWLLKQSDVDPYLITALRGGR